MNMFGGDDIDAVLMGGGITFRGGPKKEKNPREAEKVHGRCGKEFLTVTPGVRFADGDIGDQVRVMTPADAKAIGSDYIVVGRPITAAADPVAAYNRCVAEFVD